MKRGSRHRTPSCEGLTDGSEGLGADSAPSGVYLLRPVSDPAVHLQGQGFPPSSQGQRLGRGLGLELVQAFSPVPMGLRGTQPYPPQSGEWTQPLTHSRGWKERGKGRSQATS